MRIAFISTVLEYPWGGADALWTRAAEEASNQGHSLLLCVSPVVAESPRVLALQKCGAFVHTRQAPRPLPFTERLARKLHLRLGSDGVVKALAKFQPELVVVSMGGTYDLILHSNWINWLQTNSVAVRLIANWQMENPDLNESDRAIATHALSLAEHIFFVSTRNLRSTQRHLVLPLHHASVIQNPLRWSKADLSPWPDSSECKIATVSRLHATKGVQLLLHALAESCRSNNWRLSVYGRGPEETTLKETAQSLGLSDRVDFRGHVDSLRRIWSENHLLVSPSLEDGVPMTIPEAMLCERPVLATCVGGSEDWLADSTSGFLCPAPTVPLLSETLMRAFNAFPQWRTIGQYAATSATGNYKPDDYKSLLSPCSKPQ